MPQPDDRFPRGGIVTKPIRPAPVPDPPEALIVPPGAWILTQKDLGVDLGDKFRRLCGCELCKRD